MPHAAVVLLFVTSSFLLLVVMPGATSSALDTNSDALATSSDACTHFFMSSFKATLRTPG